MYQVFDAPTIFGPHPPPVDNDFTLQRRSRDPDEGGGGGGIDDVLGWLGIPSPGGNRAGYDDPSGGWWGTTGLGSLDGAGLGQLMMETDNDEAEYFDYSCLSSGLMSPDIESEFFGAPCTARQLAPMTSAEQPYWGFNPSSATLPDRPPSPLFGDFRLPGGATGSDMSFPVVTSCDYGDDLLFNSEARAKVKEIARYLASFEVQPWSSSSQRSLANSCSAPGSTPTSPFAELGSVCSSASSSNQPNHPAIASGNKVLGSVPSVGLFQSGFDDSNCGPETTMVNPNDVFPDRTDHQYASLRPARDQPHRGRHLPRSSHRTSPQSVAPQRIRASSVLEALLRSTEPIDPNKGSGAALALEGEETEDGEAERHRAVERRTPERMLKKLLTGRIARDDDLGLKGHRGQSEDSARMTAKRIFSPVPEMEMRYRKSNGTSGRVIPGFVGVELETDVSEEFELSRELSEIIRDQTARQTNLNYSITPECFRCN